MRDIPLYPYSEVIDSPVDWEIIRKIAEEARQAFFTVVVDRLNDLYPDSKTWGDEDPLAAQQRDSVAIGWVNSHGFNNTAVQEYEAEEIEVTLDSTDPSALDFDLPEGVKSVKIGAPYGSAPFHDVDITGSRGAVYDYVAANFGDDAAEEVVVGS